MSDSPRTRKPSDEGIQVPVKPIPRVRRIMSPPSAPPPPPPNTGEHPPDYTPENGDVENEELNIDDIQLTDNDKEDNDIDGRESVNSDTVAVDTVVMDTVTKDTVTNSKTTSPVDQQRKESVTTPDCIIDHSDSDDEHDYMNWSEVKMRSNDSNNEEPQGKRRPLSNYYNVAPLPEPGVTHKDTPTTKTSGLPTPNSNTNDDTDEGSPNTYRFKPKHRAPARPPPGYKKLPPVDTTLTVGTKGTVGEEGVTLDTKTSPVITRNRPVVKKTNSIPLPPSPTPRQNVPAKPPRNRNKYDVHILDNSPSSSPPPLVHPVVIPPRPNVGLKSGKSSPALEEQSSENTKVTKPSFDTTVSPLPTHKSTPSLATPRKAPLPPPCKTPDSKTPPTYRKGSLNNEVSNKSSSPGNGRKAARVAPPPPKPSKILDKGNDKDESIQLPVILAKPVKADTSDELVGVVKPPTVPPKHVKSAESSKEMDKENCEVPLDAASESKNLKAMKETINNVQSMLESPACESSGASSVKKQEEEQVEEDEIVLSRMNLFTVEMRKVDGQGFGLHIAEGYAQTSKGLEVKGVFVKEIVAGSPADNCGRVRESDMIIDIGGCSMVGASLEDAARILKQSGNIVRLKIGRTFSGAKGGRSVVADIQLSPLQEENEQLKTELASLKEELRESKESNVDLTQAIANVTVEKTKLDIQTKSLKDKLEKAKAAALAATEKQSKGSNDEVEELQKKVEQLGTTNASLEDKLGTALKEVSRLEGELETSKTELDAKGKVTSRLEEEIKSLKRELDDHKCKEEELNKKVTASVEEIKQLKEDLKKERKEKDLLTKSLSEKIISLEEELASSKEMVVIEVQDTKPKSVEAKVKAKVKETTTTPDVSEKTAPKEFIQLEKESPKKPKKQLPIQSTAKDDPSEPKEASPSKESVKVKTTPTPEVSVSSPSKHNSKESTPSRSSRDVTPLTDDEFDTFEEIKAMNRLDSSTALQKTHLSAQMRRKKPSRSHVQSLANLSPFPEEMTPLEPFNENRKSLGETQLPSVARRPKPKPEAAVPKPKPRPQPRKKQSPDHLSSPVNETPAKTTPESPIPAKRPIPLPRTPSKEGNTDTETKEPDHVTSSPKRSPLLPPKPKDNATSPEHSPAVKPKPRPLSETKNESNVTVGEGESVSTEQQQVPTPARKPKPSKATPGQSAGDSIDAKIEALKQKDPSELTVKEKMMLAQQAMVKQAEYKSKGMPPPVRRRPPLSAKAESLDIDAEDPSVRKGMEDEVDANMERSQSVDDLLDESPKKQPKKLPPGAFKLGIPMGMPGDNRMRSYTVGSASTDPSRSSLEESLEARRESRSSEDQKNNDDETPEEEGKEEEMPKEEVVPVENKEVESEEPSDITTMSTPEVSGYDMSSMNSMEDLAENDTLETNEALLETQTSRSACMQADAEQVLYWTPEVVGIWLDGINLGQYAQVIKEKDIKGYALFDMDTSRLKALGFNNDDRKTFAKEVKILKPFAEKLKKDHERQKKEQKKRLEQEKKLAKKKKK